jgi:hypothetical protein
LNVLSREIFWQKNFKPLEKKKCGSVLGHSCVMDSFPSGEGSVRMFHKLITSARRESDIHPSFPDDFYLISVGCDRTVTHERRHSLGCLYGFNRVEPDIPEESSVFYPDPILENINLCGEDEPVNEKNKRGSEEEYERGGMKGGFYFIGYGISVMGIIVEKNSHGYQ